MNLGLIEVFNVLKEKDIVQRERKPRKPNDIIFLGLLLYFKGLSFRSVADTISLFGVEVCHVSVWKWVQKFGSRVNDVLLKKKRCSKNQQGKSEKMYSSR